MSAICGVFSPRQPELASREILAAMLNAVRERGPDAEATFFDEAAGVAMGLAYAPSFVAPDEKPSPTFHVDDQAVVSLDGHIFNRKTIVAKERHGAYADLHSGAIAAHLEQADDAFPTGLDGYFAFASWDRRRRVMQVASDPLGSKLVYFYHDEAKQLFLFASELKAILSHPSVKPEMDPIGLSIFLASSAVQPPYSIQKGASKLFPAESVTFDYEGRLSRRCYWRFPPVEKGEGSFEEWTEKTRVQMRESLAEMSNGSRRIGVFASGGLDSALLLGAMADAGEYEFESFTVGYQGSEKTDGDIVRAGKVSDELGIKQHDILLTPEQTTPELLLRLLTAYDEPADTSRCFNQHFLSQAVKAAGFDSAFTGGEGESVFGGLKSWLKLKERRDNGMTEDEFLTMFFRSGAFIKRPEQEGLLVHPNERFTEMYDTLYGGFSDRVVNDDLYEYFHAMVILRLTYGRSNIFNHVTSPRAGVEVRPAYRDRALIEFSRRCPSPHKGSESTDLLRGVLVAAYEDRVPSVRDERPKTGFPGAPWANPAFPELQALVLRVIERLKSSGLIQPRRIDRMIEKYRERGNGTSIVMKLWLLFELQVWLNVYINHDDPFR